MMAALDDAALEPELHQRFVDYFTMAADSLINS